MDVGEWLRSIGLGQYEVAFRDNEIDDDVLWKLTADDLKDLGVTIVGHRRKIMTAIAEPSGSAAAPAAAAETKRLPQIVETNSGHGRAPAADGPILRSRGVYGNVGSPRSRRHA